MSKVGWGNAGKLYDMMFSGVCSNVSFLFGLWFGGDPQLYTMTTRRASTRC
jgi:hypothetical protein